MTGHPIEIDGQLWFNRDGKQFLGNKRIQLLQQVAATGSISRAAKSVGLSYKAAWDAVNAMNNLSDKPLVNCSAGGHGGGGTHLTALGEQLVHTWLRMQTEYERFLAQVAQGIENFDNINGLLRAIAMKTSARNQFRGTITHVVRGAVNGDVVLDLGHGLQIFANITNAAIDDLQLTPGNSAIAVIKSSFILLSPDPDVRISARNRLTGTVVKLVPGEVNSEVQLELPGGRLLTAIVTRESAEGFSFAPGQSCTALIKASHVLIAVE